MLKDERMLHNNEESAKVEVLPAVDNVAKENEEHPEKVQKMDIKRLLNVSGWLYKYFSW